MKQIALIASAFVVLFPFLAPSHAGQGRALYTPNAGPGEGGLVRVVRFSGPAGSQTHWAPVLGSGIYKSTDGGATWTNSSTGIDHKFVRQLRFKPTNQSTMYAATLGSRGFYKSLDGGATWAPSNNGLACTFINTFREVSSAGINQGHLYAGTGCGGTLSGVYKSTDEGANWVRVGFPTIPGNASVSGFALPANGTTVLVATQLGLYASFNSGSTWESRTANLTGPRGADVNDIVVNGLVWAVDIIGNGVWWSENSGASWTQATGLPAGATTTGTGFSQIDANLWIFIDGAGAYKSTDSGKTWAPDGTLTGLPVMRTRNLVRDADGIWWASTLAGAYKSTDAGANWTRASNGLPRGMVTNATGSPLSPQTVFAASDTIYKSTDGGTTWATSDAGINGIVLQSSGRFGSVAVDPNNASIVYATTVNKGPFKSINGGTTWVPINNGINITLVSNAANLRIAPSDSNVLWITMGGNVFKSLDAGANWSNVSAGLPQLNASSPAIDPTNPNIVYVATGSGLYKTVDGGASWFLSNPSFINFSVTRAQVMFGAPQNVLLAANTSSSRSEASSVSGVYLSTNAGATWKQLIANEKVSTAVFVNDPGGKTGMYFTTEGYFDHPVGDERLIKCIDLFANDWEPNTHCRAVDVGPNPGFIRSLTTRSDRLVAIATSSGLARHRYLYLGPDFNNDGRSDIFWRHTSGENAIWHMNGTQFLDEESVTLVRAVANPWGIAAFGDFDGNGTSDVLWRNSSTGENYIYFMDGATILSEGYIRTVADQAWQVKGVGDFDRDGNSDILWRNAATGDNYIYFMDGLEIVNEGFIRAVADANWNVAAVGDFDGDFKADILWRNGSTGDNYLYPMDGLAIKPSEGFIRTVPLAWSIKGLGDFNADNKLDIVWRNSSTGENYTYPMDGTTILPEEGYLPTVTEAGWDIVAIGDFDGNATTIVGRGHSDVLWRNSASGATYLWQMSGPTTIASQCGAMGCQSGYLPLVSDTNWQIMNR